MVVEIIEQNRLIQYGHIRNTEGRMGARGMKADREDTEDRHKRRNRIRGK